MWMCGGVWQGALSGSCVDGMEIGWIWSVWNVIFEDTMEKV